MHLCLIQRYAAHLYKWFKVIRRAYTESSFLFPYLLLCYRVSVGGPLSGHGSFSRRLLVFLRGLYLKTVSCFPFRLSGSLKSLTLRSVFLSMTRTHVHTLTHTHTHCNKNSTSLPITRFQQCAFKISVPSTTENNLPTCLGWALETTFPIWGDNMRQTSRWLGSGIPRSRFCAPTEHESTASAESKTFY